MPPPSAIFESLECEEVIFVLWLNSLLVLDFNTVSRKQHRISYIVVSWQVYVYIQDYTLVHSFHTFYDERTFWWTGRQFPCFHLGKPNEN